jgi:hypothetical protein
MKMTNINQDRLQQLQQYFDKQAVTVVEVPAVTSATNKGTVTYRFNGERFGYKFKDGFCKNVQKKDVHLFEGSHFIIHNK